MNNDESIDTPTKTSDQATDTPVNSSDPEVVVTIKKSKKATRTIPIAEIKRIITTNTSLIDGLLEVLDLNYLNTSKSIGNSLIKNPRLTSFFRKISSERIRNLMSTELNSESSESDVKSANKLNKPNNNPNVNSIRRVSQTSFKPLRRQIVECVNDIFLTLRGYLESIKRKCVTLDVCKHLFSFEKPTSKYKNIHIICKTPLKHLFKILEVVHNKDRGNFSKGSLNFIQEYINYLFACKVEAICNVIGHNKRVTLFGPDLLHDEACNGIHSRIQDTRNRHLQVEANSVSGEVLKKKTLMLEAAGLASAKLVNELNSKHKSKRLKGGPLGGRKKQKVESSKESPKESPKEQTEEHCDGFESNNS